MDSCLPVQLQAQCHPFSLAMTQCQGWRRSVMCRSDKELSPVTRLAWMIWFKSLKAVKFFWQWKSAGTELSVSCCSWKWELVLIFTSLWNKFPLTNGGFGPQRRVFKGLSDPSDIAIMQTSASVGEQCPNKGIFPSNTEYQTRELGEPTANEPWYGSCRALYMIMEHYRYDWTFNWANSALACKFPGHVGPGGTSWYFQPF